MNILYQFYTIHNSATQPVDPINFNDANFVWEGEDESIFKRKKYDGELLFINSQAYSDYDYFESIDQDATNRCLEIKFKVYRSCDNGSTYTLYWEGYFAINDGFFDVDRCQYKVKVEPDDGYRCLIENGDKEISLIGSAQIETTAQVSLPNYEFYTCQTTVACSCSDTLPYPAANWLVFHQEYILDNDNDNIVTPVCNIIYYRERQVVACVGGSPVPPSGSGWVLESDTCATNGLAIYVRTPVSVVTNNPNPEVGAGSCDVSLDPNLDIITPRRRKIKVTKTATPTTDSIKGYNEALLSQSGYDENYTYWVENNPSSTYFWDDADGLMTVVSGQGTNKVVVKWLGGSGVIRCTETSSCGVLTQVTKTVTLYLTGDLTKTTTVFYDEWPDYFCPGEQRTFTIMDVPSNATILWTVGSGATIISGSTTTSCVIQFNSGTPSIGVTITSDTGLFNSDLIFGKSETKTVTSIPKTAAIYGLTNLCPNIYGVPYRLNTRSGATYTWTVSGGTIASGQGTGEISVDWGSSGTGWVKCIETINCGCTWIKIAECEGNEQKPPFYWCPSGTDKTYSKGTLLSSAIQYLINQMGCGLTIASDFFEWNAVGDATGYVAGTNYITGSQQLLTYLSIHQKADVIDTSNLEVIPSLWNVTFNDLMERLFIIFEVVWFIDSNGLFRLEHINYFNRTLGLDLTSATYRKYTLGTNKYNYLKNIMPKYERYKWSEAQLLDFVGAEISYEGSLCVSSKKNENIKTYDANDIATDIHYISNFPDDISKDGFVLMVNAISGGGYVVMMEAGLLSGITLANAHLSWANLHYNYHRYNRVLDSGKMNLTTTAFLSTRRTKKQVPVRFPFCCGDTFDPLNNYFTTDIGNGVVEKAKLNVRTNEMEVELTFI